MKIGILTHTLSTNYGGLLQNYALQTVLKELGHEPETLNHRESISLSLKILSFCSRLIRRIIKEDNIPLRSWPTKKEQAYIAQNTDRFINKFIDKTSAFKINNIDFITKNKYEVVIVGSDQVWNPRYIKDIQHFYLSDFGENVIKIAYAASFGVSDWIYTNRDTNACRELLSKFKAVSVREHSGVLLCEKYLNRNASQVLDPTLLISPQYYHKIIDSENDNTPFDGNMMVYILDNSFERRKIVESVCHHIGAKPYYVMAKKYFKDVGKKDISECVFPSVSRWLKGFYESDFVVTDSFHGTVFSIIFKKPFIAIVNKRRGADRFTSLLRPLGLESRLVSDITSCQSALETPIDYKAVEQLLKTQRKFSLNFLAEVLN